MLHSIKDLENNYRRFIERSIQGGKVYYLSEEQGAILMGSHNMQFKPGMPILLAWSDEAYVIRAQKAFAEDGREATITCVDISDFVENVLYNMQEDGILLGPNWNADFAGLEFIPMRVAKDFYDTNGQEEVRVDDWPWHENFDPPDEFLVD